VTQTHTDSVDTDTRVSANAVVEPPSVDTITGAFVELQKVTISIVMSVRPSVRMEQLGSHWRDFHEILYLMIFRKSVDEIKVSLK
jgi:hypothetical protein